MSEAIRLILRTLEINSRVQLLAENLRTGYEAVEVFLNPDNLERAFQRLENTGYRVSISEDRRLIVSR
jgi:hypothetical protein